MKVGFIGLGRMGNPIAANILKAGYKVTINDLSRDTGQDLEAAGATWSASPKSVAIRSDVVLSALPGPDEVEMVVLGDEGVFAGLKRGSAHIDLSTISPATMRKIAEIGASRGFRVLDAPISGGVWGARDATLTIFVGGDRGDFELFQPLLRSVGKNVAYMGPSGCGNVAKLVNNFMMYTNVLSACEAMAVGVKAGIDPRGLLDVIGTSTGDSMILQRVMRLVLSGGDMHSSINIAAKDIQLAAALAREYGVPIELGQLVETSIRRFRDAGHGEDDMMEFVRTFMRRSDVNLQGAPCD